MTTFQRQHSEPISVQLARHLVGYLLSGQISAGGRIPSERQLAESLAVGRSAIREALKALTLLGLLTVRQGDGTYLASSSSELLPEIIEWGVLLGGRTTSELIEARSVLEIDLAGLAAARRTDEQLSRLTDLITTMGDAGDDLETYIRADIAFHLTIAEISNNRILCNVLNSIRSLLEVWTRRVITSKGRTDFSMAVHQPIYEAIRDGEPDNARIAMATHMRNATQHLEEVLSGEWTATAVAHNTDG